MTNPKVLITGAGGFIGKRLVKKITKLYKPSEIMYFMKTTELGSVNMPGIKVEKVDLVTKEGMEDLKISPRIIFHLAASTETSEEDHRANNLGTKNLLRVLGGINKNTHFIYTSTTAIYAGRKGNQMPVDDSTKPVPSNEYGRSKLKTEKFLIKESKKRKFRLTIVRLCTVYGRRTRKDGLFDKLRKLILKGSLLPRLNWPGQTSLIYVNDVVEALTMISSSKRKSVGPKIYILHSDPLSISEISRLMHKALRISYKELKIPELIWRLSKKIGLFVPYVEKVLPAKIYNVLWRFILLVDDPLHCESTNFSRDFPEWKPKKFNEVVTAIFK